MSSKFFSMKGGLDLSTPPLEVSPGTVANSLNFFESVKGGYTRVAGYERFDGHPAPSDAEYHLVTIEQWDQRVTQDPLTVGGTITVGAAVFTILLLNESTDGTIMHVVCREPVGTPPTDLGTNPLAFDTNCLITDAVPRGADSEIDDFAWMKLAQDDRRQFIAAVPGDGPVRGVAQLGDNWLAWRDDSGVLKAYKATSTGWAALNYAQVIAADATTAAQVGDILNSGDYVVTGVYEYLPSDPAKQMLTIGKANPAANDLIVTNTLTRDSDSATIGNVLEVVSYTWTGGGKVRFINHNFYGGAFSRKMYFCDGVNCAAEFDPDYGVISPIATDYRQLADVVHHIIAHNSRLFMATGGGTFITSLPGEPGTIDGLTGSQEVGVGDLISGFAQNNSASLTIYTQNSTQVLQGTGPSDWRLDYVSTKAGAHPDCIAVIDDVFSLDDRGINQLSRTDKLGGFDAATVTDDIQSLFRELKPSATCAVTIRTLSQMRFFFGNRYLFLSRVPYVVAGQTATRYGIMEGSLNFAAQCASSEEDSDGTERVLVGGDDGFIYQLDRGPSFDGDIIPAVLTVHPNTLNSPSVKKRYRYADFVIHSKNAFSMEVFFELESGKTPLEPRLAPAPRTPNIEGAESGYDKALWNVAVYDGFELEHKRIPLTGTGTNIKFSIIHDSDVDLPFTIHGYTLTFSVRGLRSS